MKVFVAIFVAVCCLFILPGFAAAQNKTIILVRHAEKVDETSQDPELSAEGKQRAERLIMVIGKYKPGAFYSTNFKRTRDTAAPLAAKRKKQVEIYDPKKPADLIDTIMKSKIKRFFITGHSNTIPGLANALGKKELFKNLEDSEYGVFWVIGIRQGTVRSIEVFPF